MPKHLRVSFFHDSSNPKTKLALRCVFRVRGFLASAALIFLGNTPTWAVVEPVQLDGRPAGTEEHPIVYWTEPGFEDVEFPVHFARVDLQAEALQVVAVTEPAPKQQDKVRIELPSKLAQRKELLVAINANPFNEGGFWKKLFAEPGQVVSLYGAAITEGQPFEGSPDPYAGSLWVEPDGSVSINTLEPGALLKLPEVQNAVSGFHQLIKQGKALGWGGEDMPNPQRIARSVVGVSGDGRWLYLVVAEGKRTLFRKEGYTEYAMTRLMQSLDCHDALVLDGGGSAVLVIRQGKEWKALNRPSNGHYRPIPVMLGVRAN